MPKAMSFSSGDDRKTTSDEFEGYERYEVFLEKQPFFSLAAPSKQYRIEKGDAEKAIVKYSSDGYYERGEKLFDVEYSWYQGRYSSYEALEVQSVQTGGCCVKALKSAGKSLIAIKDLELIKVLQNKEQALACLSNREALAVVVPTWKDSDSGRNLVSRIYIRSDLQKSLHDLLIIGLIVIQNDSLWCGLTLDS